MQGSCGTGETRYPSTTRSANQPPSSHSHRGHPRALGARIASVVRRPPAAAAAAYSGTSRPAEDKRHCGGRRWDDAAQFGGDALRETEHVPRCFRHCRDTPRSASPFLCKSGGSGERRGGVAVALCPARRTLSLATKRTSSRPCPLCATDLAVCTADGL